MPKTYTAQELAECPKITVVGKQWSIPIFGPRQNRRIIPIISRIGDKKATDLSIEDVDDLYSMVYWALTRAYPDQVTEQDFADWEIDLHDAMMCIPVIAKQTGLMRFAAPKGEAQATEEKSTGTSSSPASSPVSEQIGTT